MKTIKNRKDKKKNIKKEEMETPAQLAYLLFE